MIPHIPPHLHGRSSGRRRWLPPVITVLAAAAIAIWAINREARRMDEVERMVLNLCRDAGMGKDVAKSAHAEMKLVSEQVAARLKSLCPTPETAAMMQVRVTSGDTSGGGGSTRYLGTATHTAMIHIGDEDLFGLRVRHDGDPERIIILGCFDARPPDPGNP